MFPRRLPRFADSYRRISLGFCDKLLQTARFELRIGIEYKNEVAVALSGKQVNAASEAVVSLCSKQKSPERQIRDFSRQLIRSLVAGGVVQKVSGNWNGNGPQAIQKRADKLRAIVKNNQDIN